ncbi:MAG: hypothetical protein ACLRVB_01150 [Blautia sp.]
MAKSKLVKVNEKIAKEVVGGYKKIEDGVVGGYKKIEEGAVGGFNNSGYVRGSFPDKRRRNCREGEKKTFRGKYC